MVRIYCIYITEKMTKTILLTLTYLVGIGDLILAIYFWVTNSKNEIRRVLGLAFFAVAMWGITNTQTRIESTFIGLLPYVFGPLALTSILHFSIIYPLRKFSFDKLHAGFLYIIWLLFSYLVIGTKTVIIDVFSRNGASYTTPGPLFFLFNIYLGILFVGTLIILVSKFKNLDGMYRQNVKIAFWSILIGGLPGIYFAVFHFAKDLPYNYLYGPIGTIIWPITTLYVVKRK